MSEPSYEALLAELASLYNIEPAYWDVWGNLRSVSPDTQKTLLHAMGPAVETAEDLRRAIAERHAQRWRRVVDPTWVVLAEASPATFPIFTPFREDMASGTVRWRVSGGGRGLTWKGTAPVPAEYRIIDGLRHARLELPFPKGLEPGYYALRVSFRAARHCASGTMHLIVTPRRCYLPPTLEAGQRAWGLAVNLYALRSEQNWGIGDLRDLEDVVGWAAGLGAGAVGINPLHALGNRAPHNISPYTPITRLYRNYVYLHVEGIADFAECEEATRLVASPACQEELNQLRQRDTVDYDRVSALKRRVLETVFRTFLEKHWQSGTRRGQALARYIRREGEALASFATFCALWEHFRSEGPNKWRWTEWPDAYRSPQSPEVDAFREAHAEEVLFHQYLQWVLDEQMARIGRKARKLGLRVGLYHDLAVGSDQAGSDTWAHSRVFAMEANLGAPPDAFSRGGQDWALPPLNPERLQEEGYAFFIGTIRKNLRHGGALRIDHILGLFRFFWVPQGQLPTQGTYVRYPTEDLLRIIALESVRNQALIVGEDLGTVGEGVRETLARFRILSCRLLYFERDTSGAFLPPSHYPAHALAAVTTHDLPTLAGFWHGRDIALRRDLGLYPEKGLWQEEMRARERDRARLLEALRDVGVLPEGFSTDPRNVPEMTPALCRAVYAYLARTPCHLVMVNLDDLLGVLEQPNLPGTVETHPNWSRKVPLTLAAMEADARPGAMAEMFRGEGRG